MYISSIYQALFLNHFSLPVMAQLHISPNRMRQYKNTEGNYVEMVQFINSKPSTLYLPINYNL